MTITHKQIESLRRIILSRYAGWSDSAMNVIPSLFEEFEARGEEIAWLRGNTKCAEHEISVARSLPPCHAKQDHIDRAWRILCSLSGDKG